MINRIRTIASYIGSEESVLDIGTDHAQLLIFLYDNNISKNIVGTDLNPGPLRTAKKNIGDRNIQLLMSDGLSSIEENFDNYVIAGMGGILISKIIQNDIEQFKKAKRIILQPMQHIMDLRKFLFKNNFKIDHEHICYENNRFFEIIVVSCGQDDSYDFRLFKTRPHGMFKEYVEYLIKKYEAVLSKIPKNNYKISEINDIINELKKLD